MIDLHVHSTASDGSLSPAAVIEEAARRKLTAVALTDHDTIEGLEPAKKAADALGIRFIPGVEVDIAWTPGEFHLLGLGLYRPSDDLRKILEELRDGREARNRKMLAKMAELGIPASYESISALSGGEVVGRPHFAAWLVANHWVKNREQAFDRYLAKGRPLFEDRVGADLERSIRAIHDSGAVAILAHPMSLYLSWGKLPEALDGFRALGLDGIEAWHPGARKGACRRLEELARQRGWLVTAGSDFHGEARPERRIGLSTGDMKIEDGYMEGIPLD